MERDAVVEAASVAARVELAGPRQQCDEETAALAARIGRRTADLLGLPRPGVSGGPAATNPRPPGDAKPRHGLYIDDAPRVALAPDYLERLDALVLDEVSIMAERSGGDFDVTWTARDLARFRGSAPPNLRRVLCVWPEPTKRWMTGFAQALPQMLDALETRVVELDLEGAWKARHVRGYASLAEAGADLVETLRGGGATSYRVSTFGSHLEAMDRGAVRGECALIQQSYTIAQVRGEARDYDGRYGPSRRPEEDLALTRQRGEAGVRLGVALAAWGQAGWPGEPADAMREAYASALRGGAEWVYWWSSKHAVGAKRNRYAASAIASLTRGGVERSADPRG
jgi:hypothetical protein